MKTIAILMTLFGVIPTNDVGPVTHEWGTFTSVAGEDGNPIRWAPLSGPSDLPCFVENLALNFKYHLQGRVRMETPVLYFYSPRPMTLSVHVDFPQGWITEWYPKATKVLAPAASAENRDGRIDWDSVELVPGQEPAFPPTKGASHYYAARNTDSTPLRVGEQQEKLLFYRGVGDFQVPLRPRFIDAGKLEIRNAGPDPIPLVILFENRAGKLGYRIARNLEDVTELPMPELTADLGSLRQELANDLVEFGLFKKEALAMLATWSDSWFEEGMRVFYIVPRARVDAWLPLRITPAPSSVARVFVGRVEVLSPAVDRTIQSALSQGDIPNLTKFGRFVNPFMDQIRRQNRLTLTPDMREHLKQAIVDVDRKIVSGSCVQ